MKLEVESKENDQDPYKKSFIHTRKLIAYFQTSPQSRSLGEARNSPPQLKMVSEATESKSSQTCMVPHIQTNINA